MPSTVVTAIKYFPEKKVLRVIYVSGSVYDYKDVPENVYAEMKSSESKGGYLNKFIKRKYEFSRVA